MTISLSYDDTLSRVVITGTNLAEGYVRVERSPNGLLWETVRGATALEVVDGEITAYDYEFAADTTNYYRIVPAAYEVLDRPAEDQTWGEPWQVPAGVRALYVQCWGAGGATSGVGSAVGGAGGGAYAADAIQVTPGEVLQLRVGRSGWNAELDGNSTAVIRGSVIVVQAAGGYGTVNTSAGAAGGSASFPFSIGAVTHAGGNGGDADVGGGGGGGSATADAAGGDGEAAAGAAGGAGGAGEGPGGAGGDEGMAGELGGEPGGGAGGHGAGAATGLVLGGHGRIIVSSWPAGTPEQDSITPSLQGRIWLKNLRYPALNRPVTVTEFSDLTRPARAGLFDVKGRSLPVAVSDQRGSTSFELVLVTETSEDARRLDLALTVGGPWMIHTPPGCPVPGGYVAIGNTTQRRRTRSARSPRRYTSLPCTVEAPPGPDVVPTLLTWATVRRLYGSWAALIAAHPTWADLLETVGSEEDVVVL